jgi:hypothetical protein
MTLRLFVVVVTAPALLASQRGSRDALAPGEIAPTLYHGFTLSPGSCESAQLDCAQRIPKGWTTTEIDIVKEAIDEIVANPRGKQIALRAQERGLRTVNRFGLGTNNSEPVSAIAASLRRDRISAGLNVHDRFFAPSNARDAYSGRPGYLIVAETLLHECMHAVDDFSTQPEFSKVAGFVRAGARTRFSVDTADDVSTLNQYETELLRLEQARDFVGQWRMNRRLALRMRPIRVPTMQSTRNPAEAFAEIGSHLILDPAAPKYLPSQVVLYFDTNVFGPRTAR